MRKDELTAVAICALLSLTVFIGSTGHGYAVYRPLRFYDIFSLLIAWAGFAFYLWRGRRRPEGR
jgi:hypothetical protein